MEALSSSSAYDPNDDDDFTPTPRSAFHTDPVLCQSILSSATVTASSAKLEIKSSLISMGSGLFVSDKTDKGHYNERGIPAGREIYRSKPVMWALDHEGKYHAGGGGGFCDECGQGEGGATVKACSGCLVAGFCGKKCQKAAWNKFHKDECKTLRNVPVMKAQNLLAHRLIWWQQRGFVTTKQGKVIEKMESHFNEYTKDKKLSTEVFDIAVAVRSETGGKVNVGFMWNLVPKLRTNCVRLRPASQKESIGCALDLLTATINHSCDPNAFVFFEGTELRVRSLKKIAPGEEITICYIDPTIDVSTRQEILLREHFFNCRCTRCKSEQMEEQGWIKKAGGKLENLHKAQREIVNLTKSAVKASKFPGIYKEFDDLGGVETTLRTIMCNTFPATQWPDIIEPVPLARLCLAMLYLDQGKPDPALRNALRGKLVSRRRTGPEWVNEMMDVIQVLMVAGSLTPDKIQDPTYPNPIDIQTVTYGYMYETCKGAGEAFGGDSEYTKGICELFASLVGKKVDGEKPGSRGFEKEFVEAQGRLMEWAVIAKDYGVVIH
ncbi:hypothetical protein QBC43DRAFT_355110 [Cladorrhinum sp. PSN259]|nr:hypothetical protein QBC43DRAFT_355110 [Cladorrhinum sp. PSN259]